MWGLPSICIALCQIRGLKADQAHLRSTAHLGINAHTKSEWVHHRLLLLLLWLLLRLLRLRWLLLLLLLLRGSGGRSRLPLLLAVQTGHPRKRVLRMRPCSSAKQRREWMLSRPPRSTCGTLSLDRSGSAVPSQESSKRADPGARGRRTSPCRWPCPRVG